MQKRGKRGRRSVPYSRIPSLERREGWREDWKDKQMERRQKKRKGESGERNRLPFLSPDEKPRGLWGARDNREGRRRRGKKEGCD